MSLCRRFVATGWRLARVSDLGLGLGLLILSLSAPALADPPLTKPDSYRIPGGAINLTVGSPGVLANDADPDGDPLQASVTQGPSHGSLYSFNSHGGFVYENWGSYTGLDSFEYVASDGTGNSVNTQVQIDIHAGNQPVVATNDIYSTPQDTPLLMPLLGNDSDPDNDWLSATYTSVPQHGSLSLGGSDGVIYTPDPGYFGTDSFNYYASDGMTQSDATVTITVNSTNQPPVANDNAYTTPPDTTLNIPAPGPLDNDSDPEGHALTAVPYSISQHGTLVLLADGRLYYYPDPGFVGTDSITYRASDGARESNLATVTITVQPANQAPVAGNDQYAMPGDTVLNIPAPGLLDNDNDPDGNPMDVVIVTQPAHGHLAPAAQAGGFSYTPDAGFSGVDSFTYKANDGQLDSNVATAQITVNAVNQAPAANDDSFSTPQDVQFSSGTATVLDNDNDPDGDKLKAVLVNPPQHGTLSLTIVGGVEYLPDAGYSGQDSFTYRASDGKLESNTATVHITIDAANQPPVAVDDAYSIPQDTGLTVPGPGVLANDKDPEGHTLFVPAIVTLPTNGILSPQLLGGFTYMPNPGFTGVDTFTYRASDTQLDSNVATVKITVTPSSINQPPVAVNDAYSAPQDGLLTVPAPGLTGNDNDPEGHSLKVIVLTQPANGFLALTGGGFTYTPSAGYSGSDSFTYKVNDGKLDSNVATVQITVTATAANLPPVAVNDSYSTKQDKKLDVLAPGLLSNDSDPEGHLLSGKIVAGPTHGFLSFKLNGGFTYTPDQGFSGIDTFTYRVSDGALSSNTASVTITVKGRPTTGPTPRSSTESIPTLGRIGAWLLAAMMLTLGLFGLRRVRPAAVKLKSRKR